MDDPAALTDTQLAERIAELLETERAALVAGVPDLALEARVELTVLLVEADRRAAGNS